MQIATSPTREQFPLSVKKVIKKTLAGTLIWTILIFVIYLVILFISNTDRTGAGIAIFPVTIIALVLVLLILAITYLYQQWYYSVYYYDLQSDFIVIRKGPITPREITIPYERVQDVYVDQDLLDRLFGLYDVHLSSATISSGMEAHIDGVEKPAADGLRNKLLQTVNERISKKAVSVSEPPKPPTI